MTGSVMVLSAASGAGHLRAADALVAAFAARDVQARHVEVLKYTNPIFRRIYSDLYVDLVNKQPEILGWLYNALDRPWQFQKRRLALDRLNTVSLVRLLKKEKPGLRRGIEVPIKIDNILEDHDASSKFIEKKKKILQR